MGRRIHWWCPFYHSISGFSNSRWRPSAMLKMEKIQNHSSGLNNACNIAIFGVWNSLVMSILPFNLRFFQIKMVAVGHIEKKSKIIVQICVIHVEWLFFWRRIHWWCPFYHSISGFFNSRWQPSAMLNIEKIKIID